MIDRQRFDTAFENAHGTEFCEFEFDMPDYNALMVTEDNYLEHLRVQAAGIAYYGTLAKTTERECDEIERHWKARYNEMYIECSDKLAKAGKKNVSRDVESLMMCKYESEMEKWEKAVQDAKAKRDATAAYYEAWKAKGFALSSMTSLITAGLLTPKPYVEKTDRNSSPSSAQKRMPLDILTCHNALK